MRASHKTLYICRIKVDELRSCVCDSHTPNALIIPKDNEGAIQYRMITAN
jgi:hypothetical protein